MSDVVAEVRPSPKARLSLQIVSIIAPCFTIKSFLFVYKLLYKVFSNTKFRFQAVKYNSSSISCKLYVFMKISRRFVWLNVIKNIYIYFLIMYS